MNEWITHEKSNYQINRFIFETFRAFRGFINLMNARTTTVLRRVLNYLLYLVLCFLIGTGFLLDFRFPQGRAGRGLSILGLDRHEWRDVHSWAGYLFAVLIIFHLWLAWKWLTNIAVKRRSVYMYAGLAAGVVLIVGLLLMPISG